MGGKCQIWDILKVFRPSKGYSTIQIYFWFCWNWFCYCWHYLFWCHCTVITLHFIKICLEMFFRCFWTANPKCHFNKWMILHLLPSKVLWPSNAAVPVFPPRIWKDPGEIHPYERPADCQRHRLHSKDKGTISFCLCLQENWYFPWKLNIGI